jgi:hypothetical protein
VKTFKHLYPQITAGASKGWEKWGGWKPQQQRHKADLRLSLAREGMSGRIIIARTRCSDFSRPLLLPQLVNAPIKTAFSLW